MSPHVTGTAAGSAALGSVHPRLSTLPSRHTPHAMARAPRRRVACACIALRLPPPAGPTCVSPPARRHPREHPGPLRRASGPHCAIGLQQHGCWGECHAGERDRWQRAPVRVACLSPEYMLSGNPSRRSVCPCTVSHSPATTLSRTYVKRAVHAPTNPVPSSPPHRHIPPHHHRRLPPRPTPLP